MMQSISISATQPPSFDDVGLELVEFQQSALQDHAATQNSLRSLPIASYLYLVDEVPELPNTAFMTQLMTQLNAVAETNGVRIHNTISVKAALMRWIIRHRDLFVNIGIQGCATSLVNGVVFTVLLKTSLVTNDLSDTEYQARTDDQRLFFAILTGSFGMAALSLVLTLLFEFSTRNAVDPFLNGPNVIDQNIVDPNELNNHPQNVHAASVNRIHVTEFQALQAAIAHPVDKTLTKEHLLQVFDYLCKRESDFKGEMIALNQTNSDATDADRLQAIKVKIENAIDYMFSDAQADRTPMHYPSTVTTAATLTHVWSCIEQLSAVGYEPQARLLTENLMKALYASYGLCNTGHVSRVLQAFTDTVRFGFNQPLTEELPPVITPQDFYTLNQNDLNTVLNEVINTHTIRAALHNLEAMHTAAPISYKAAATLLVKEAFASQLSHYLLENHALVLQRNPQLQERLMHFLDVDFAAFIDNARDDEDTRSIASFSPV